MVQHPAGGIPVSHIDEHVLRQPVSDVHGGCLGNGLIEIGAVWRGGDHEDIL